MAPRRKNYPGSQRSWSLTVTDDADTLYDPDVFKTHTVDPQGAYTEYIYGTDDEVIKLSTGVYKFTLAIPYADESSGWWETDSQALDNTGTIVSKEVEPFRFFVEKLGTL